MPVPLVLVASLFLSGTSRIQDTPQPAIDTISSADAEQIVGELAQRTLALDGFVARYRSESEDEPIEFELAYAAPDRALLRMTGATGERVEMWTFANRMVVRGGVGADAVRADFDPSRYFSFGDAYERAETEAFGPPDTRGEAGPGPMFALDVVADAKRPEGVEWSMKLAWESRRRQLFSWLDHPAEWDGARREGGRIVRDGMGGTRIALSLESGFIDEIRLKKALRLVELRIGTPEDSTFVVPERDAKVRDITAQFAAMYAQQGTAAQRKRLYVLAVKSATGSRAEDADLCARVVPAFGAFYDVVLVRAFGSHLEKTEGEIDAYLESWRELRAAGDPARQGELDLEAAQRRAQLATMLDESLAPSLSEFGERSQMDGDAGVLAEVATCEQLAIRGAHARTIGDPLLRRFDDGLRAAAGG